MVINQIMLLISWFMPMHKPFPPEEEKNPQETPPKQGSRAVEVRARHSQGSGVGYRKGYTTLQSFIVPKRCPNTWSPFVDLRARIFNNGKFAANTGIGVRRLSFSIALGANAYYDYRNTNRFHYNQIGAGLEAIGSFWSLTLNGYLPIEKKQSGFFNYSSGSGSGAPVGFAFFKENELFVTGPDTSKLNSKNKAVSIHHDR